MARFAAVNLLALALAALAGGCDDGDGGEPAPRSDAGRGDVGAVEDAGDVAPGMVGVCDYENPFSRASECKAYTGDGWTAADAEANCAAGPLGSPGTWRGGQACMVDGLLGVCAVDEDAGLGYDLHVSGTAEECGTAENACTGFLEGTFTPSQACGG